MWYQPEKVINAILGRNRQNLVNFVQIQIEFFFYKNLTWKSDFTKNENSTPIWLVIKLGNLRKPTEISGR